jgi:hypothetical protein
MWMAEVRSVRVDPCGQRGKIQWPRADMHPIGGPCVAFSSAAPCHPPASGRRLPATAPTSVVESASFGGASWQISPVSHSLYIGLSKFQTPADISVMNAGHGSDEDIEEYVMGQLGAPGSTPVVRLEEHLLTCPQCMLSAEEALEFARAMRETIDVVERASLTARNTRG